jgi:hypothetical protein
MNNFIPNTTQVPNIVFDIIMKFLSGAEFKVLLFFIRQRYGFQKFTGSFQYSIKQICEGIKRMDGTIICNGTGLTNKAVINALNKLYEKKLINKSSGNWKDNICNTYELTIDKYILDVESTPSVSVESTPSVSVESTPSLDVKSTLSGNKEEINKKQIETNKGDKYFLNLIPDNINTDSFINSWKEWVNYKIGIKNKLIEITAKKQINFLSKHDVNTAIAIIEKSITSGWQGLFELKQNKQSSRDRMYEIARMIDNEVKL